MSVVPSWKEISEIIRLIRLHQWPKNALIFVPLILAHEWTNESKLISGLLAFAAMSLASSATYVVNDLLDIQADRLHPRKRLRPFAAGNLSKHVGISSALLCLVLSIVISLLSLPPAFLGFVIGYVALSFAYSLAFKKLIVADVMVLSTLYGLRLLAGGAATEIIVSPWLLAFSAFLFLSLAFLKRFSELKVRVNDGTNQLPGRGYQASDLALIQISGLSSALMSVVVFFIYIAGSEIVRGYYSQPLFLWLIGPILIYWLTRIWFLAERGVVKDDPVDFALRDWASWILGITAMLLVLVASTG